MMLYSNSSQLVHSEVAAVSSLPFPPFVSAVFTVETCFFPSLFPLSPPKTKRVSLSRYDLRGRHVVKSCVVNFKL